MQQKIFPCELSDATALYGVTTWSMTVGMDKTIHTQNRARQPCYHHHWLTYILCAPVSLLQNIAAVISRLDANDLVICSTLRWSPSYCHRRPSCAVEDKTRCARHSPVRRTCALYKPFEVRSRIEWGDVWFKRTVLEWHIYCWSNYWQSCLRLILASLSSLHS